MQKIVFSSCTSFVVKAIDVKVICYWIFTMWQSWAMKGLCVCLLPYSLLHLTNERKRLVWSHIFGCLLKFS